VALRMQSTTSQLRFFSRPDETKYTLVDLQQVIASAIKLTRAQCDAAQVNLQWAPSSGVQACVMGQSLRLEQVIVNLLINAFAAVNDSGQVIISLEHDQHNWLLRVIDNGAGFGAQDPEELFEAFYTTKASTDGMGLGWLLVQPLSMSTMAKYGPKTVPKILSTRVLNLWSPFPRRFKPK